MPANLKQIAARTGVSIKTVSRILSGQGDLHSSQTRERVLQAARDLGYLSNSSARALRRGRFGCLALVLSSDLVFSLTPAGLLDGMLDAAAKNNLHITLARLSDQELVSADSFPKILQEWLADGLLINYNTAYPQQMLDLIERHAIPAIWINTRQVADCVFPDDFDAGRQAAEHLLSLGHRRIAYVDWTPGGHYSVQDRREGYLRAMHAAGLPPSIITTEADVTSTARTEETVSWLRGPDRPTAVVTYTQHIARPLLYAACALGLDVPRDLSIITFGDEINRDLGRAIDTMVLPERAMGETAVNLLLSKITDPSLRQPPQPMPARLESGWSTAPPGLMR